MVIGVQEAKVGGRDLHGVEQRRGFFGLDAAMEHHLANFRDSRLNGGGIFELREVDVNGGEGVGIIDVDGRWAHHFVKLTKPVTRKSGTGAGVSICFSLFADLGWLFDGRI